MAHNFFTPGKRSLAVIDEMVNDKYPEPLIHEDTELTQTVSTSTQDVSLNKPKVSRTQFSIYQKVVLEQSFNASLYVTAEERDELAFKLGLSPITVQTWFKNRRFKWRKQMKTADASRTGLFIPPPSLLVQPSPLSFPVWQPCIGSEHQQSDGNLYGYSNCCGVTSPRMLNFSKTQW